MLVYSKQAIIEYYIAYGNLLGVHLRVQGMLRTTGLLGLLPQRLLVSALLLERAERLNVYELLRRVLWLVVFGENAVAIGVERNEGQH